MMMTRKMEGKHPSATPSRSSLAFDPGHNTGIAYGVDGELRFVSSVHHSLLTEDFVRSLVHHLHPTYVIIEEVPSFNPDKITLTLFHRIRVICEGIPGLTVVTVNPGIWKPLRQKVDPMWNEHIKDAVGLMRHGEENG